ncbi:methyltransferase domain-containing protein, partial [Acinetobacter schindleri]
VPNFAQSLIQLARPYFQNIPCHKALDIGCATGRASFELAQDFDQVTGLDFSARFIQQGVVLAQGETLRYSIPVEGELVEYKSCSLAELELEQVANKVEFYQADACNLKPQFKDYD